MPEQPKQPKNLIVIIVFITIALVAAGGAIYYYISQVVNFSPDIDNEATVPCRCLWVSEDDETYVYAEATGHLQGSDCVFPQSYEIGGVDIEQCSDITELDEIDKIVATQTTGILGPGVISLSSSPVLPPAILDDDNQTVTFTVDFSLYNLDLNIEYEEAEMVISYPDIDASPESLVATLTDDNATTYTYIENGQTVTGYRVTFLSTWNEVLNYGEEGLYKVAFRARDTNGVWTDSSTGTLQYIVGDASEEGYFCNNVDIVQTRTTGSANVTIDALANLPEGHEATYTWDLDLDCSGEIDDDETFSGTSSTITKEFTYPADSTSEVECSASVTIELDDGTDIEDRSKDSCLGYITLNPLSEMCGDGILDEEEECDPEIEEDDLDYIANCQDDCTVLVEDTETEDDSDSSEETDDGTEDDSTITTDINISQTCPSCISLSDGSPTAEISITVSNAGDISKTIRAVSNTLPQGFVFTEGSSTVNEITNTSDEGITVEISEESQLITWDNEENGWTVTAGGSLVIEFSAVVGATVEVGTYSNTVTVTPSNNEPVQSIKGIVIAQDCEQPETALFDRTIFPILIGTSFLLFASLSYYTGLGTKRFSKMMDQVSDLGLLVTQPQKYRENRIEETALKEIKKRSKARK
jgi:uncharacterized repeat protein (TIGR01451 family)